MMRKISFIIYKRGWITVNDRQWVIYLKTTVINKKWGLRVRILGKINPFQLRWNETRKELGFLILGRQVLILDIMTLI